MNKFYLALILSLLFHLSQYELLNFWSDRINTNKKSQVDTTEIEIVEKQPESPPEPQQTKNIVKTATETKPQLINKPAEFLSDKTNRVKQQTRAQESGQFRNSESQKTKPENTTPKGDFFTQNANLPSRSEYQLPNDIQTGSATNLNTDADIYASFYNRVTDLFYIRWVQRLDQIWDQTPYETKRRLSGRSWITDVEILLKSDGQYHKGLVLKKSGYSPFDDAALFGFYNAQFFPNPPKAKVDPDGFIRLRYRINIVIRQN